MIAAPWPARFVAATSPNDLFRAARDERKIRVRDALPGGLGALDVRPARAIGAQVDDAAGRLLVHDGARADRQSRRRSLQLGAPQWRPRLGGIPLAARAAGMTRWKR